MGSTCGYNLVKARSAACFQLRCLEDPQTSIVVTTMNFCASNNGFVNDGSEHYNLVAEAVNVGKGEAVANGRADGSSTFLVAVAVLELGSVGVGMVVAVIAMEKRRKVEGDGCG